MDLKELPLQAEVKHKGNMYGSVNLYCYWSINVESSKSLFINFTKNYSDDDEYFALQVIKDDSTEKIFYLEKETYTDSLESVQKIQFRYLMKNPKSEQPFLMSIAYIEDSIQSYMTVLIVIGVVICLCIVSCVIFWYCGRSMIQRNRNRNREQRRLRDENNSHSNSQNQNRNNPSIINNQELEKQNIGKNKLFLIALFKNEYKSIEYNQLYDKYASNCTICLENYLPNVLVIKINCNHLFHSRCLKQWCEKNIEHPKCPNCMKDIIPNKTNSPCAHNDENEDNHNNIIATSSRRTNGEILLASDRSPALPRQRQHISNNNVPQNGPAINNLISIIRRYPVSHNMNRHIVTSANPNIHEIVLEDYN